MNSLIKKGLIILMAFSMFASLFGCNKKTEYPFDEEKAYCYTRSGVIAGGSFMLNFAPEGIVEYYSYVKEVPEYEAGMKDKGADIYFAGLKPGRVEVTATYKYPTCEDEIFTFNLEVAEDLTVTRID